MKYFKLYSWRYLLSNKVKIVGLVWVIFMVCSNLTSGRIVRQEVSSVGETIGYAGSLVERVVKDAIRIATKPLPEEYVKIIQELFPEDERVSLENVGLISVGEDKYFLIEVKINEIDKIIPFILSTKDGEMIKLPYENMPEFFSRARQLGLKTVLIAVKTKRPSERINEVFQTVSSATKFNGWQDLFRNYIDVYEKVPEVARMYATEASKYSDLALHALSLAMGVDLKEVKNRLGQFEEGIKKGYLEVNNRILKVFSLGEENYKNSDKKFTYIALSAEKELLYIIETLLALKEYFHNPCSRRLNLIEDTHKETLRRLIFKDRNRKNIDITLRAVQTKDPFGHINQACIRLHIELSDAIDLLPLIINFEEFGLEDFQIKILVEQLDEISKIFYERDSFSQFISDTISFLSDKLGIDKARAKKVLDKIFNLWSLNARLDRVFSKDIGNFGLEYDLKGPALMLVDLITEGDILEYHFPLISPPELLEFAKEEAFKTIVLMFY